jgi:hypothetical protein
MPYVIALWILVYKLLKFIWRKINENLSIYSLGSDYDEPIISSADMLSGSGLTPMANGQIEGYNYHILSDSTGKVMMFIVLGHNTDLHVIAIGGKSGLSQACYDGFEAEMAGAGYPGRGFPGGFPCLLYPGQAAGSPAGVCAGYDGGFPGFLPGV